MNVAPTLAHRASIVAYDRRGFGQTAPSADPFSHVEDLLAVLDDVADGPAWLVGSSMGGGLAIDAALVDPARVGGLVLLAPAVSGAPTPQLDANAQRIAKLIDHAAAAENLDEVNRLETWLWLDGPAEPKGRVSGPARELALAMNAVVLCNHGGEQGVASGVDAWSRLEEISLPCTVTCGDRDVEFLVARSHDLADRLPRARHRVLAGMAHLPYLEHPDTVAALITDAIENRSHRRTIYGADRCPGGRCRPSFP